MSLASEDVQAIAQALQELQPKPDVNAVALKLPPFWMARPAVWFSQVEAQFATRQPPIVADLTKFNYVVAALDNVTAGEVEASSCLPQPKANTSPLRQRSSRPSARHRPRRTMSFSPSLALATDCARSPI